MKNIESNRAGEDLPSINETCSPSSTLTAGKELEIYVADVALRLEGRCRSLEQQSGMQGATVTWARVRTYFIIVKE